MPSSQEKYKVSVPVGQSGNWSIERFEVTADGAMAHNLRCAFNNDLGSVIYPGTYTRLKRGKTIVMSDTPSEVRDHLEFIRKAKGNCLVAGLGIGMVLSAILPKKEVKLVHVVELSEDVIKLTGDHVKHEKLTIYNMSIEDFVPAIDYDCVWLDIWDTICGDNLKQIHKLKRKFSNKKIEGQYVGAWSEKQILRLR